MSETVTVALITGGAALLGSAIGLIANILASKWSAKQRLWTERHTAYANLVQCYTAFVATTSDFQIEPGMFPPEEERHAFSQLQCAYSRAVLLCDTSTLKDISAFFSDVTLYEETHTDIIEQLNSSYQTAFAAMRKELLPHCKIKEFFHKD